MRVSTLTNLLAGAAFVSATPVLERKDENTVISRDVTVVYKDCELIAPKVFIISMVRALSNICPRTASNIQPSSPPKLTSGTPMPRHLVQLVTC
jgi:hypothetical protein